MQQHFVVMPRAFCQSSSTPAAAATLLVWIAGMRLRAAKDRLKVEHSIIDGLRPVLERLLADNPQIASIIPGEIKKVRNARGPVQIRVTVPTRTGWKAIALSQGARQELFVNTKLSQEMLESAMAWAIERS